MSVIYLRPCSENGYIKAKSKYIGILRCNIKYDGWVDGPIAILKIHKSELLKHVNHQAELSSLLFGYYRPHTQSSLGVRQFSFNWN